MTQKSDFSRGFEIVTRWRILAEQRLEYLNELHETGRWRRFHTEQAFVDNIRDAKRAVEAWRKLAPKAGEASADVLAFPERAVLVSLAEPDLSAAAMFPAMHLADGVRSDHDLREA